jgi:thiosulfate/3-mercaptopyruvate sulfurtransferase
VIHGLLLAAAVTAGSIDSSLLVSTDWLAKHLHDPGVVVLHVDASDSAYRAGHIPGARFLRSGAFIVDVNGNSTELPAADSLRDLFESVGVSTSTHVVLVGAPLVVSRAFFTFDYIGLAHVSVLNGGMTEWRATGHAVERRAPAIVRGHLVVTRRPEIVAGASWIVAHQGKPGMSLIDTRREDEYNGTAAGVAGHIAGARQVDWQSFFRNPDDFALKDVADLQRLWRERVAPGDTVVAYCRVGHRSSATYFVSRLLGLPVKLYDGSYEEWSRLKLPVVTTATPLLKTLREGSS